MVPVWIVAGRKLRASLDARRVPLLAIAAAFSFVIMMFNVPIPGGSTGHATGAALIAILLGPWAAVLAISVVLAVQALMFGDGGVTAIGANCLNMAVVMPFVSYAVYRLIAGSSGPASRRRTLAAGIAAYIGLNAAAVTTAVMFGLQPLIAHGPDGRPLYAPFPLKLAVSAMAAEHLLVFGFVEAVVTAVAVSYLARTEPDLVLAPRPTARGVSG
jgi:cobalt/nickel transport system permease protein